MDIRRISPSSPSRKNVFRRSTTETIYNTEEGIVALAPSRRQNKLNHFMFEYFHTSHSYIGSETLYLAFELTNLLCFDRPLTCLPFIAAKTNCEKR